MLWVRPVLSAIPLGLLVFSRRYGAALFYAVTYSAFYFGQGLLMTHPTGTIDFLLLLVCGLFSRFLPGFMAGYYLVSTTTVSEFVAAMHRMHVTDKIVIPLSVMFRFIPTVVEESQSIQNAMRMRGVRFGGDKTGKILEYRLIPTIACSVMIGEELSAAALTRGLGAPVRRTNVCRIGLHVQDIVIIALCLLAYVVCILGLVGAV